MDTCYYVLLILPLSVKFAVVLVTLHLLFLSISCVSCITTLVGSTTKAFIHACHKHSDDHSMHTFFSNFRIRMKVVLLKRHVNTLPTLTVFLFGMTEYWTKNKKYLLTCTIVQTWKKSLKISNCKREQKFDKGNLKKEKLRKIFRSRILKNNPEISRIL